jgi:predicted MFS family arabinose efflux permease
MPTSTTTSAPAHMRQHGMRRYMSAYSLTWGVAQGIGSLGGGFLADSIGPSAPWLAGGIAGALAVTAFLVLARRNRTIPSGDRVRRE